MKPPRVGRRVQIYLLFVPMTDRLARLPRPYDRAAWILVSFWRAIWLGLLEPSLLNEVTWSFYAGQTDFESENFNVYQGLWRWEADAFAEHFIPGNKILVAGVGGGREAIALARLGYQVTGFDFSPSLIDAGRKNVAKAGFSVQMLLSAPDSVPEELGQYDAMLIGRGFYHHIPSRKRRVRFLDLCHKHIKTDAPVIISDFFTRQESSKYYSRTKAIADCFRKRRSDGGNVEIGDWLTNTFQHAFTREEIEGELIEAGIKLEVYKITPINDDSRLAYILGRIA
jgi:SAM-dependent methyltransferase